MAILFCSLLERIRGGIAQSGSSLSPWAKGPPGAVRRMTLRLAENAGCKQTTTKEIADCLRLLAPEKLVEASKRFTVSNFFSFHEFAGPM